MAQPNCFEIDPVFENCPLKIESLALWGAKLLVGTSEGLLLIMGEETKDKGGARSRFAPKYQILDTKRSFSKNHKPITQLDVVELDDDTVVLISLSDCINVHALSVQGVESFSPISTLAKVSPLLPRPPPPTSLPRARPGQGGPSAPDVCDACPLPLPKTKKDCNLYCLSDKRPDSSRTICAAVKRKLVMYTLAGNGATEESNELTVSVRPAAH